MLFLLPSHVGVRGISPARLEVWSPDLHSSNLTSLTLFPVGKTFTVRVNFTYTGQIATFDINLNYNLTVGPNVLQAVSASLNGGIIDPNGPSPGPHCTAGLLALDVDGGGSRPGHINVGGDLAGGCTATGTGILFSVVFKVVGIGAGSIDIDDGTGNGSYGSQIAGVDSSGRVIVVSHDSFSAYFRNKAGIPPVPAFTFYPPEPVVADRVTFNATGSYDPENKNAPDHGIAADPVIYDANGDQKFDGADTVLLGPAPPIGTPLKGDTNLLFVDSNHSQKWDPGETVVYESSGALSFRATDVVVNGTAPPINTVLAFDPSIRYAELHPNFIWNNGYVWDFGDGSSIEPGIVASHIFKNAASLPSTGIFEVKLVVFDRDDNLPMRQITPVTIVAGIRHDVVLILTLSSPSINVGDPLNMTIRLTNVGNRDETVNVNTNYTLHGGTSIGQVSGLLMPVAGPQVARFYALQTGSLAPGSYVVRSQATLVNATTGAVIPYTDPSDSFAAATFIVRSPQPYTYLSLPLLAGGGVAVVAIISAAVFLLRRRRKEEI